jgi:phosphatidylinositol glycan class C protein
MTQQLSTTLLFVGFFLHLQAGIFTAEALASASAITIVLCASLTQRRGSPPSSSKEIAKTATKPLAQPLSYALLCLVILALSPLLKTLTEATTGDSIAALSTALFLLSFTLADYSAARAIDQESKLPATLSLNASLCSSIVLASRLEGPIEAFSLMLTSILLFAFIPRWTRQLKRPVLATLYTITITLASCSLLAPFSITASVLNLFTALFLSLACPAWMRKAQGWKVGRSGPWDVGIPRLRPINL